jgi:hypothetical protein
VLQAPSNALETVGTGRIQGWIRGDWPNCTTTYGPPIGTTSYSDSDADPTPETRGASSQRVIPLKFGPLTSHATELAGGIRYHPFVGVVIFRIFSAGPDKISSTMHHNYIFHSIEHLHETFGRRANVPGGGNLGI